LVVCARLDIKVLHVTKAVLVANGGLSVNSAAIIALINNAIVLVVNALVWMGFMGRIASEIVAVIA
jgi:hypothetical protein